MAASMKFFTEKLQEKLEFKNSRLTQELNQLKKDLDDKDTELQQSKAFLSLRFDGEQAEGVSETDVTILAGEKEDAIHAHRIILADRSSVFEAMFGHSAGMRESTTGIVHIKDSTLPVVRAVIRFCYCAEVDFNEEVTAEDVVSLAHRYSLDFLIKICEDHLIKTTDISNLSTRMVLAEKLGLNRLKEAADRLNEPGSCSGFCMR